MIDETAPSEDLQGDGSLDQRGSEAIEENADPDVKDAALIAAAQKVEHYEIAAYSTLATWAKLLNLKKALGLLVQTINEEKSTDEKLTELAKTMVNEAAMIE